VHSISGVQSEIGLYCQRKGGAYQNGFCREANEPDLVLFYAMVSRRGDCQNVAFPVGVQIIEPKGTNLQSPGYLSALRQVGYVTQKEVLEAAVERERMADEKAQREKARLAREMPMLTSRGTKICHIQNSWTYVGYVEDAANQKIKIHISAMQALGGGPPISHEELIWDFPSNWHVCE
jgi:hypothetical protein